MDAALTAGAATSRRTLSGLLELLRDRAGADLTDWRAEALAPRLEEFAASEGAGPEALLRRAEGEPTLWPRLVLALVLRPPRWFADPGFFGALRARVAPLLRTHPSPRVWAPGEAGGEEAAGLAILLEEEGVADRYRVYATSMVEPELHGASKRRFAAAALRAAADCYVRGGGRSSLDSHFAWDGTEAELRERLARRLVVGQHSLSTDGSINEFHLIVCRRALDDYNPRLRARAQRVFWESLAPFGILALAPGEAPPATFGYEPVDAALGLFRRKS